MKLHKEQKGFTILELMIATAVFSVILLVATYGLLQVGRMFYKGVTISRTQEAARATMEEIAQNIQFSGQEVTPTPPNPADGTPYRFCLGNRRYSYVLGRMMSDSATPPTNQVKHVLVVDTDTPNCASADPQDFDEALSANSKELLQPNMRLAKLIVEDIPGTALYRVSIRVLSGDDELIEGFDTPEATCKSGVASAQFCASAELTTTVLKRINVN